MIAALTVLCLVLSKVAGLIPAVTDHPAIQDEFNHQQFSQGNGHQSNDEEVKPVVDVVSRFAIKNDIDNRAGMLTRSEAASVLHSDMEQWTSDTTHRRGTLYIYTDSGQYEEATSRYLTPSDVVKWKHFYREGVLKDHSGDFKKNHLEKLVTVQEIDATDPRQSLHGQRGVFVKKKSIRANTILGIYSGILLKDGTRESPSRDIRVEMDFLEQKDSSFVPGHMDRYAFELPLSGSGFNRLFVSALNRGNALALINSHWAPPSSETDNPMGQNCDVTVIRMDNHIPVLAVHTTKPVLRGEELLMNYGSSYWQNGFVKAGKSPRTPIVIDPPTIAEPNHVDILDRFVRDADRPDDSWKLRMDNPQLAVSAATTLQNFDVNEVSIRGSAVEVSDPVLRAAQGNALLRELAASSAMVPQESETLNRNVLEPIVPEPVPEAAVQVVQGRLAEAEAGPSDAAQQSFAEIEIVEQKPDIEILSEKTKRQNFINMLHSSLMDQINKKDGTGLLNLLTVLKTSDRQVLRMNNFDILSVAIGTRDVNMVNAVLAKFQNLGLRADLSHSEHLATLINQALETQNLDIINAVVSAGRPTTGSGSGFEPTRSVKERPSSSISGAPDDGTASRTSTFQSSDDELISIIMEMKPDPDMPDSPPRLSPIQANDDDGDAHDVDVSEDEQEHRAASPDNDLDSSDAAVIEDEPGSSNSRSRKRKLHKQRPTDDNEAGTSSGKKPKTPHYRHYRRREGGETDFLKDATIPREFLPVDVQFDGQLNYDTLYARFGDNYFYAESYPMKLCPPRSDAGWERKSKRLQHDGKPVETLRGWLKLQLVKGDSYPPIFHGFADDAEKKRYIDETQRAKLRRPRQEYSPDAIVPYSTWRDRQLIFVDGSTESGTFVRFRNREERELAYKTKMVDGRSVKTYGSARVRESRMRGKQRSAEPSVGSGVETPSTSNTASGSGEGSSGQKIIIVPSRLYVPMDAGSFQQFQSMEPRSVVVTDQLLQSLTFRRGDNPNVLNVDDIQNLPVNLFTAQHQQQPEQPGQPDAADRQRIQQQSGASTSSAGGSQSNGPSIQFALGKQRYFGKLNGFISKKFPETEIVAFDQRIYQLSFYKRGIQVNGKCLSITRAFSHAFFAGSNANYRRLLENLGVVSEIYEQLASGKPVSNQELVEVAYFDKTMRSFEENVPVGSSLPLDLSDTSTILATDLATHVSSLDGDFALHIVTSRHVVGLYRRGNRLAYFDSNFGVIDRFRSLDDVLLVTKLALLKKEPSKEYGIADDSSLLVERFHVAEANHRLSTAAKSLLFGVLARERTRLAALDASEGPLRMGGGDEKFTRVQLYDMGLRVHARTLKDPGELISARMDLSSDVLKTKFEAQQLSVGARNLLDFLGRSKDEQTLLKTVRETAGFNVEETSAEKYLVESIRKTLLETSNNNDMHSKAYEIKRLLESSRNPMDQGGHLWTQGAGPGKQPGGSAHLFNAAGRIVLAKGLFDIGNAIAHGEVLEFYRGTGELGLAFSSQLIEDAIVHLSPRFLKQWKHGVALSRGFAGFVTSVTDMYDLVTSSIVAANSLQSSKQWQDAVASATFSGVSTVSGTVFTALGKPGIGTVVGLGLIIGQGIYQGASTVQEFQRYNLTTNENFRLFWYSFGMQLPPKDIQFVQARQDFVDLVVKEAWNKLQQGPDSVVAVATGLGEVKFERAKRSGHGARAAMALTRLRQRYGNDVTDPHDLGKMIQNLAPKPDIPNLLSSHSVIDLRHPMSEDLKLARIIPKNPDPRKAVLNCMPSFTGEEHEFETKSRQLPATICVGPYGCAGQLESRREPLFKTSKHAIFSCKNAAVISRTRSVEYASDDHIDDDDEDVHSEPGTMVFDMSLIFSGEVYASSNYSNLFLIFNGHPTMTGGNDAPRNTFKILENSFNGYMFGGSNSTNILDVSSVSVDWLIVDHNKEESAIGMYKQVPSSGHRGVIAFAFDMNIVIGRQGLRDEVFCTSDSKPVLFDARGGNGSEKPDLVHGCRRVVASGFMTIEGRGSGYQVFAPGALGGLVTVNISEVFGNETNTLFLPNTPFAQIENFSYVQTENLVEVAIKTESVIGPKASHIQLHGYFRTDGQSKWIIVDADGAALEAISETDFKTDSKADSGTDSEFLKLTMLSKSHDLDEAIDEFSSAIMKLPYNTYGVIQIKPTHPTTACNLTEALLGTPENNGLPLTSCIIYAYGGPGEDVYILKDENTGSDMVTQINNDDELEQLDMLKISGHSSEFAAFRHGFDLIIGSRPTSAFGLRRAVVIKSYFKGSRYGHLAIIDGIGASYVPDKTTSCQNSWCEISLLPFYKSTDYTSVFVLHAQQILNQTAGSRKLAVDAAAEDLELFRNHHSLWLSYTQPLSAAPYTTLVLQDYFENETAWHDLSVLTTVDEVELGFEELQRLAKLAISTRNLVSEETLNQDQTQPVYRVSLRNFSRVIDCNNPAELRTELFLDDIHPWNLTYNEEEGKDLVLAGARRFHLLGGEALIIKNWSAPGCRFQSFVYNRYNSTASINSLEQYDLSYKGMQTIDDLTNRAGLAMTYSDQILSSQIGLQADVIRAYLIIRAKLSGVDPSVLIGCFGFLDPKTMNRFLSTVATAELALNTNQLLQGAEAVKIFVWAMIRAHVQGMVEEEIAACFGFPENDNTVPYLVELLRERPLLSDIVRWIWNHRSELTQGLPNAIKSKGKH